MKRAPKRTIPTVEVEGRNYQRIQRPTWSPALGAYVVGVVDATDGNVTIRYATSRQRRGPWKFLEGSNAVH